MIKQIDRIFMRAAFSVASESVAKRLKVGCVMAIGNEFGSFGFNRHKHKAHLCCEDRDGNTLPEVLHAEDVAIDGNEHFLKGATAYITHSPCLKCAEKMSKAGIRRVVYKHLYRIPDGLAYLESKRIEVVHFDEPLEWFSESGLLLQIQ